MSDRTAALASFRRAIAADPAFFPSRIAIAAMLSDDGLWKDSAAAAERAIAIRPESGPAWALLGVARVRQAEWTEGLKAFEKAHSLGQKDADTASHVRSRASPSRAVCCRSLKHAANR